MFDKSKLKAVLDEYKKQFVETIWPKEKVKWEAVKYFQVNRDIEAVDFAEMISKALPEVVENLFKRRNYLPIGMIKQLARKAPEEVRAMFEDLFDESRDLYGRIDRFKEQAEYVRKTFDNEAVQHFQTDGVIIGYLWLRYPDKYYIYKFREVQFLSSKLGSDYTFKLRQNETNIPKFLTFLNEICDELQKDEELKKLLASQLTDDCYPDPALRTLTSDVGHFVAKYYDNEPGTDEWWPKDYKPGLSVDDWEKLLNDSKVFNQSSLEIMKRILDYGGEASCTQLANKYGENKNFYNTGSSSLAKRIVKKTECAVMPRDEGGNRWWSVLYLGKNAKKGEDGSFIWKLRDELAEALKRVDLSEINLYAASKPGVGNTTATNKPSETNYWFLIGNPKIWSMSGWAVNAVQDYTLYTEDGYKRRVFQNFLDAKVGDIVIGYESTPVKQIVAIFRVSAEHDGKKISFQKIEGLSSPIDYSILSNSPELADMEGLPQLQGSLFKLTREEYEFIIDLIRNENPISSSNTKEAYTKTDFLNEVYMTETNYDRLAAVLKKKKNIILQGAPGVGKTFAAKRLAQSIMGEADKERIEFVQFHQNYSYEDFMMGYKPVENGFELKYGIFYRFCQKAVSYPDKDYFFIIDEINRGNLSKIFGELLMLIEADYRDEKIRLAYNDVPFSVPNNLYIIGMMNTADRSLAMIDYALRRRFSFFDMEPGFDSQGFVNYQNDLKNDTFDRLIDCIKDLNQVIIKDESLGKGFCIGHSYFCNWTAANCTDEWMKNVVDFDILPMLSEYWFDENSTLQTWEANLHGVFK